MRDEHTRARECSIVGESQSKFGRREKFSDRSRGNIQQKFEFTTIVGQQYEHGAVVFFELQPGLTLALWPRASLAHDVGLPVSARGATNFALAHNVRTRGEVDTVMAQARAAGAMIVKEAQETFYGGFAGYFQDPDGHLWEIAWNPAVLPPE